MFLIQLSSLTTLCKYYIILFYNRYIIEIIFIMLNYMRLKSKLYISLKMHQLCYVHNIRTIII